MQACYGRAMHKLPPTPLPPGALPTARRAALMTRTLRVPQAILALVVALGGCTVPARYPSLAQRPAELAYGRPAAEPSAPPPAAPDPAIVRSVAGFRADATRSAQTFARRADEAEHLAHAAHGTPVGSEAWAATTVAMAALDSARSDTAQPLAQLDEMQAKMGIAAADSGSATDAASYDVIARADAAVGAMLADENTRIEALHATTGD